MTPTEIRALQTRLAARGFSPGEVDGLWRPKTRDALWAALEALPEVGPAVPAVPAQTSPVVDLTAAHPGIWRRGARPWGQIDAVVLHQCDGDLGEDHERWIAHRYRDKETGEIKTTSLRAHVGVTRGGQVLLVNPLNELVHHGNGFNRRSIGVECSGVYEGILTGATTTRGKKVQRVTPELIRAAQDAVRWVCAEAERNGGRIKYLFAHRQSSASRRPDPGEEIWRGVALPLLKELGLSDGGPAYRVGTGYPLPREWGEGYEAGY